MESIFLISAGMLRPKKRDTILARRHYYLNYGLLSLATKLFRAGHKSKVVHGLFRSPEDILYRLKNLGYNQPKYPLLISLPSFYALTWGAQFCRLIKNEFPKQFIIVGGRWVVNNRVEYIYKKIPEIDLVVCGTAEDCIVKFISAAKSRDSFFPASKDCNRSYNCESGTPNYFLEYDLLDEAVSYNPSIEVSRGCGMGCKFCEERSSKLMPIQKAIHIVRHMEYISKFYGTDLLNVYFEASNFIPSARWAKELYLSKKSIGLRTCWRCESRVDTINLNSLSFLAKSGLKVMDIGLESASPIQLQRMGKTKNFKEYLSKASELLNILYDLGIWSKINILLYPGETYDTINETLHWLNYRRHQIKGVSVGPLTLFGLNDEIALKYGEITSFGAKIVEENEFGLETVKCLNLSDEISLSIANEICQKISRMFMNAKDYFDLKSFSYFSRDYSYNDFQKDIINSDIAHLNFSINK